MRNSAGFFCPHVTNLTRRVPMIYAKKALTLEQQADLLLARGLVADRDELIQRLKVVNYYRLSGYLHPFRQPDDSYLPGTTLETVWRRYNFDRRLRILLLDAIERIEVAVRTRLVYHFVQSHGPFGYLDERKLPRFTRRTWSNQAWRNLKALVKGKGLEKSDYELWLSKLRNEKNRAGDAFVKHFEKNYGDKHEHLPLWMACELMTCETLLQFANAVEPSVLTPAAADFGFPDELLRSWMKAIFSLRNACAHHARVWNRTFGTTPALPGKNKHPLWHRQPTFGLKKIGLMLTVCHHWLGKVSPTSQWKQRLWALFDEYPEIPLAEMGLPDSWRTHPLWV
jgi:abortive infection bacteriophage resistance protein